MTTAAHPLGPVQVFAYRDGDAMCLMLLDGQSLPRVARACVDTEATLASLTSTLRHTSSSAQARTDAAQRLHELMYPGEVGRFLRESPTRPLALHVPPEFDAMAWEQAGTDGSTIGRRFGVARQVTWPEDTAPLALDLAPEPGLVLRVARIDAGAVLADSPGDMPILRPIANDMHLVRVVGGTLAAALARHELPSRRCLVVGELGTGDQRIEVVRRLLQQGHLLLDVGTTATVAIQDDLFTALCQHIEAGHSIAEAVRRMRAAGSGSVRGTSSLVLYARTDCTFIRPTRAGLTQRDLRPVTALSYDIVNSTGVLEKLEGQRYAPLNQALHERCQAIVTRHGGVSRYAQGNDGCMNYFGYGTTREDDPERALHAAREIAAIDIDKRIRVRVGVATGDVSMQWGDLYGLSIHLAAHLQARAMPGTVLVSLATQRLTSHRFDLQPLLQKLHLKNIRSAQQAWLLLGPRREVAPDPAVRSPFVGRDAELASLSAQWAAAVDGASRSVLVVGDAGIGKSRLLHEFRRRVPEVANHLLQMRCTREASASAFQPLVEALHGALELHADDTPVDAMSKLRRHAVIGALTEQDVVLLARLLGIAHPWPADFADATPERIRLRTLGMLVRWFAAMAQVRPLCLLVEDIHWIDRSSAEFIDGLRTATGSMPMLMVLTRRHGRRGASGADAASDWLPATVDLRLDIDGLSPDASLALVDGLCRTRMERSSMRLLVQRGDGVPLFLEESVRMALALRSPSAEALRNQVPETLRNLLIAQLDALGPARVVMLLASVLGREFSATLLRAVVDLGGFDVLAQELDGWLAIAERSGLLHASGEGEQRRYVFKHALVRDAANRLLWDEDRAAVHRAVVKALRGPARELAERQPELLAVHLAGSGRKSLALAQWLRAADRAASRSARHEQASHLRNALELSKGRLIRTRAQRDRHELELQRQLASCYIATEGYGAELVEKTCARAALLSRRLGDDASLLTSELGLEGCYFMRANFPLATEYAQRAQAMAVQSALPRQHLQARWAIANIRFHEGDGLDAVRLMDECLKDYAQPAPGRLNTYAQDPAVMCWCYSGWGQWELGHPDDAVRRIAQALALARRLRHPFSIAVARAFAINVRHYRGETRKALLVARRCVAFCEEHGFPVWKAHALVMRGRLRCESDAVQEGLRDMAEGNALWTATKATVTRPLYLAMHAEGLAIDGRPEQGLVLLDQALALVAANGERYYEAELHRLVARLTLACAASEGEPPVAARIEAERSLLASLALARTQGKRGFELRSAIDLARLWGASGDYDRARRMLAPLLEGWTEGLQTRDLRAAHEVWQSLLPMQAREEEHVQ